eukprot:9925727-Lingulodinium_polyedra.AAC.1
MHAAGSLFARTDGDDAELSLFGLVGDLPIGVPHVVRAELRGPRPCKRLPEVFAKPLEIEHIDVERDR